MTMGTAMVARMKVRRTGLVSFSDGPMVRLMRVRVGKTAIQIIRASWCLVGGPTTGIGRAACEVVLVWGAWLDMVVLLRSRGLSAGRSGLLLRSCAIGRREPGVGGTVVRGVS